MRRLCALGMCVGLMGCGSVISDLDGLPAGRDLSDTPWPRLVDTPAAPEGRLIPAEGEQARARLTQRRGDADARLSRADSVAPVSETLLARGDASRTRTDLPDRPTVNEADLVTRAEVLRARTQTVDAPIAETDLLARAARIQERVAFTATDDGQAVSPIAETDLLARAARIQERVALTATNNRQADSPVVESDLLARAARIQERAAGVVADDGQNALLARSTLNQQRGTVPAPDTAPAVPPKPRVPAPLRSLDTPVVSSDFEERARLARERAAGL